MLRLLEDNRCSVEASYICLLHPYIIKEMGLGAGYLSCTSIIHLGLPREISYNGKESIKSL